MNTVDDALAALDSRFLVIRQLGAGATGVALLARPRDSAGGGLVVVKVLLRAIDDLPLRRRFQREVEALERLSHPDAVRCLGWGEAGGLPYLVTEYHEDVRSLTSVLAEGPMTPSAALEAAAVVADVLAACHRAGFVHRDVKPDNILIRAAGRPLLIDFGLAAGELLGATKTATGVILGTPAYMAPEVIRGEVASPASDVCSLGCVLFEMLAGRPLFPGPLGRILADKGRPARLPPLPDVPGPARSLLERLVDPDPKGRPGDDVPALLREAATACAGVGSQGRALRAAGGLATRVVARPAVPAAAPVRPGRPRLVPALVGAVLLGAVLAGLRTPTGGEVRPESLSFEELGRTGDDDVLAGLSLSPACPLPLRGRLWLARHHLRTGRPGAAFDLLVPVLREGAVEGFADPAAVLGLARAAATDEVRRSRMEGIVEDLALSGGAGTTMGREALRVFRERPVAARVGCLERRLGGAVASSGVVGELARTLADLPPILSDRVDLARTAPAGLAAILCLVRVFSGPTDDDRARGLAGAAEALKPEGALRVSWFDPRLLEGVLAALPDGPLLEGYQDFLTAAATAEERIPGGGGPVLERLRARAMARLEARRSGEDLYDPARASGLFGFIRDHELLRFSHPALLLAPETTVRWKLASAWMFEGRADESWKLLAPMLADPFLVPPMAEHVLGLAVEAGRRPWLGERVRQVLERLLERQTSPERRALVLVALAGTHWPLAASGVPTDALLASVGLDAVADPRLAEAGLLRTLPTSVAGTLCWGATSPARGSVEGESWAARMGSATGLLGPALKVAGPVERWFALMVGRLAPATGPWTPAAVAVADATSLSSAEERFLHCLARLRRRDGGGDYLAEVAAVAREIPDERRAAVDACMVDESYLGTSELLLAGSANPVEALATAGVGMRHVMEAWPEPAPWRVQMQARVARTLGDLTRDVGKDDPASVRKASVRLGEPLPAALLRYYRRLLATAPAPLHEDIVEQALSWLLEANRREEAEALLRRNSPETWPLRLRWRGFQSLSKVLGVPGRLPEAWAALETASDMPYAIPGQIRTQRAFLTGVSALGAGGR